MINNKIIGKIVIIFLGHLPNTLYFNLQYPIIHLMTKTLTIFNKMARYKGGKWLFGKIICWKAPYFATIKPQFIDLRPSYCEIKINKRRAVENHLHTVHAIAMANMCELCAGMVTEVTIPSSMRWIPTNMQINYIHKAKTDLRAIAQMTSPSSWDETQDLTVPVSVIDAAGKEVVNASITMRISARDR